MVVWGMGGRGRQEGHSPFESICPASGEEEAKRSHQAPIRVRWVAASWLRGILLWSWENSGQGNESLLQYHGDIHNHPRQLQEQLS